ncbi:MAG TPA: TonB family protein, partial [Myxococcaceae bacterium]|nr:TonB family protein [Myxococcaceae bacterium]
PAQAPPPRPPRAVLHRPLPPETPPPNDTPPEQDPGPPAPVVVGLTLRSTTVAGTVAAPVGNTLMGKPAESASAPGDVAPLYVVDTQPELLEEVKIPYPAEARRLLVAGSVVVRLTIDAEGRVVRASLVSGPGHGLNEAALDALKGFRFRPASRGGKAMATQITYTYTFSLHDD